MAKSYQTPQLTIKNCDIPEVLNASSVDPTPVDPTPVDVDMLVADLF